MIEHLQTTYVPTIQLLWPALLCAAAALLAGAMVGTFILLRRESLLALAVPQAVVLGSAVALRTGVPPFVASSAAVGLLLACVGPARRREYASLLLPAIYIGAMALAVLLVAGDARDMIEVQNQYVGIDVAIDVPSAVAAASALFLCGGIAAALWRRWLVISQFPESASLANARPGLWHVLLLTLLAIVAIIGTGASGIIITLGGLFIPSTIGLLFARRLPSALATAALAALAMLAGGFVASIELEAPLGYSIASVGFIILLAVVALAPLRRRPPRGVH